MNGKTHAGLGATLGVGAFLSGVPLEQCVIASAVSAGAALGPDIDHPNSTVTKAFPPVHKVVYVLSRRIRELSSTPTDLRDTAFRKKLGHDPEHRALTHTGVSCLMIGVFVFALVFAQTYIGSIVFVALSIWALQRLLPWKYAVVLFPGVLTLTVLVEVDPLVLSLAATLGWLSHVIADGCTQAGVPFLWPWKITSRGGQTRRWRRFRLLGKLLPSGHQNEWIVALVLSLIFCVPGATIAFLR